MKSAQIIHLGTLSGIYADKWGQFEWFVYRHQEFTTTDRKPKVNSTAYPAWLALVEFLEQRIQQFIPQQTITFER